MQSNLQTRRSPGYTLPPITQDAGMRSMIWKTFVCLSKVLSENIVIRKSLGLYQPIVFCKLDLTILTSLCYKHCSAIYLNLKSKMKAINLWTYTFPLLKSKICIFVRIFVDKFQFLLNLFFFREGDRNSNMKTITIGCHEINST